MDKIQGYAWMVDGKGHYWLLAGRDPAGTPMAVYSRTATKRDDKLDPAKYRALRIEDAHAGIIARGPLVTL